MKYNPGLYVFILIFFGTLGLLVNEFIFNWGTTATVFFSIFNLIGLSLLIYGYFRNK